MSVKTEAWILPRPRRDAYPGSFPLHFEQRLVRMLGGGRVLHPFGGMSECGLRLDIRIDHPMGGDKAWRPPDVRGDAHMLPFRTGTFDLVICDPPYSNEESRDIYHTGPIVYKRFIAEAVRVTKAGGFVASYHRALTPRPDGTDYFQRILMGGRVWHSLRAICIFRKYESMRATLMGAAS